MHRESIRLDVFGLLPLISFVRQVALVQCHQVEIKKRVKLTVIIQSLQKLKPWISLHTATFFTL